MWVFFLGSSCRSPVIDGVALDPSELLTLNYECKGLGTLFYKGPGSIGLVSHMVSRKTTLLEITIDIHR